MVDLLRERMTELKLEVEVEVEEIHAKDLEQQAA